ncbi:MAG: hypothetical protein ACI9EW_001069 [Cellvibrionaceae bacterium]|jgi:hypothetical protein
MPGRGKLLCLGNRKKANLDNCSADVNIFVGRGRSPRPGLRHRRTNLLFGDNSIPVA